MGNFSYGTKIPVGIGHPLLLMKEENKLRKLRVNSNLTQEELSNQSGISIRTIQRLEKGLTSGSSYTLKALARALHVQHNELHDLTENRGVQKGDINTIRILNFSILSVLLIPFGNIILPTIIYLRHKKNKAINKAGRKIIGFQIVSSFILFFLSVLIFLFVGRGNGAIPIPVFISYCMIVVVNSLIVIRTAIDIDQEKEILNFFPIIF